MLPIIMHGMSIMHKWSHDSILGAQYWLYPCMTYVVVIIRCIPVFLLFCYYVHTYVVLMTTCCFSCSTSKGSLRRTSMSVQGVLEISIIDSHVPQQQWVAPNQVFLQQMSWQATLAMGQGMIYSRSVPSTSCRYVVLFVNWPSLPHSSMLLVLISPQGLVSRIQIDPSCGDGDQACNAHSDSTGRG